MDVKFKYTQYFENEVLRKRSYLKKSWCENIVLNPVKKEIQADDRIKFWGYVPEFGNRAIRVITLEDGETIHNAFPDRNFKR